MESPATIPDKAARYADEPVDARRGSDVVRELVLEHGGWRAAAAAAGTSVTALALTAAGIPSQDCDKVRAALPGRTEIPRWRRWARNAKDTIAMALAFPVVLGYAGARHRAVPSITMAQALPVAVIAAFFLIGALAKVDLANVTVGKESFWLFRVGFGMAIAIAGLYAAGFAAGAFSRSGATARYASIAVAVAIGYVATIPFGNAVADLATELSETRVAFERNRAEDAAIMAKLKEEPGFNPLPRQRVMQKRLLEATRQEIPAYLESDDAYVAHIRKCFGGGKADASCAPAGAKADDPMSPSELFASLWKRHRPPRP